MFSCRSRVTSAVFVPHVCCFWQMDAKSLFTLVSIALPLADVCPRYSSASRLKQRACERLRRTPIQSLFLPLRRPASGTPRLSVCRYGVTNPRGVKLRMSHRGPGELRCIIWTSPTWICSLSLKCICGKQKGSIVFKQWLHWLRFGE